jgi:DNA repair protein RadC
MAIHERPREKLQERGASALTDAELLAILIGSGTRGRSAVDMARRALQSFGSLREFMRAERKARAVHLGPLALMRLEAGLELPRGSIWMSCEMSVDWSYGGAWRHF